MPTPCSKSKFTGTHVFEVYKATDSDGGREKAFEAVRCAFCHAPAPVEDAARVLELHAENKRIRRLSRIQTDDQKRAAAAREVAKKEQKRLV